MCTLPAPQHQFKLAEECNRIASAKEVLYRVVYCELVRGVSHIDFHYCTRNIIMTFRGGRGGGFGVMTFLNANIDSYSKSYTKKTKKQQTSKYRTSPNSELIYQRRTDWFTVNKLSDNIKQSNFMIFRPRQKRQTLDIKVYLSNQEIHLVNETVFLGVVLDEHLTWLPRINNVTRKISKSIGIIYKASFCLPQQALKTLYYSLV